LELPAPAKLNLFLEVVARRPDGYHDIDSVFAEIDLADTVVLAPAGRTELTVEGEAAGVPADPTNLAWRAADALGVAARIRIVKRIPVGGGLGGGSSDAAAVLKGLVRLFDLDLSAPRLHEIARGLGADVPFFLHGGTARCRGIGDLVEPLPGAPRRRFALVVPPFPMETAAVYAASGTLLTGPRKSANVFARRHFGEDRGTEAPYFNRLQQAAESIEPRLRTVRQEAERRFGARFHMTGSGSAYFADIGAGPAVGPFPVGGEAVRVYGVETR
jgi:4-diphosphocytidyl-2-C-methyl-D-erythritol kinase